MSANEPILQQEVVHPTFENIQHAKKKKSNDETITTVFPGICTGSSGARDTQGGNETGNVSGGSTLRWTATGTNADTDHAWVFTIRTVSANATGTGTENARWNSKSLYPIPSSHLLLKSGPLACNIVVSNVSSIIIQEDLVQVENMPSTAKKFESKLELYLLERRSFFRQT